MFGLVGKKLSHSYSKIIHEKLNRKIEYNLYETESIDDFFKVNNIKGLNVTIPYKEKIISKCKVVDSISSKTLSVNTVVYKDGCFKGYNTDYFGLEFALNFYDIELKNKNIIIIGNGSTSRTIKYLCENSGAKNIYVVARNPKENEYDLSIINTLKNTEIIFNATPVGMFPDNYSSFDLDYKELTNIKFVMDLVYNPLRSNMLLTAEKYNIQAVNGLMMLIAQAVKSAELFYDTSYNTNLIISIYKETLLDSLNIVFIGMPMSGKTFTARAISNLYKKKLIDTDKTIEINQQNTVDNIFKNHGEKSFRLLENEVVDNLYKSHGLAVSCGGGIMLNQSNITKLKQNGLVIFIDVPLAVLSKREPRNRPLLTNKNALNLLFKNRYNLYVNSADIIIKKVNYNFNDIREKIEVSINEYINS